MIRGTLEIDGFAYDWQTAHPIVERADGSVEPDEKIELHVLHIVQPPGAGPDIRLVFNDADFDEFQRKTTGSQITVASAIPSLVNGHPR